MVDPDGDGVLIRQHQSGRHHRHPCRNGRPQQLLQGQTVYCNVAAFSGGSDETQYRWWLQQRDNADSSCEQQLDELQRPCVGDQRCLPEGQIRIHCQARDDSVDPVDQVNSFSALQTVKIPSMGQPGHTSIVRSTTRMLSSRMRAGRTGD